MEPSNERSEIEDPLVFKLQLLLLFGFTSFALSVILWIVRLIYVSWELNDTFSGSISIAIVAGTVFFVLLSVFHYIFWGLRSGAKEVDSPSL